MESESHPAETRPTGIETRPNLVGRMQRLASNALDTPLVGRVQNLAANAFGERPNVGRIERIASLALGGLLAYGALRSRRAARAGLGLLAAGFAERGLTGRCPAYRAAGIDTSQGGLPRLGSGRSEVRVDQAITLCTPRETLYERWRDLESLPQILRHVESVRVLDDRRSHWVVGGPLGARVEWDAEITEDRPGERIAWRSVSGSDLEHEGEVRFADGPPGRGSQVAVTLCYRAAAGPLNPLLRKIGGRELREDLRRFKQRMEAGEIPTTDGQPAARPRDRERGREPERERGSRPLEPGIEMKRVRPADSLPTAQEGGTR